MCTQDINIDKYGFSLKIEKDGHSVYTFEKDGREVELSVSGNSFTLGVWFNDNYKKIADRYSVTTQEQLDFLIFNGRVGVLFMPIHSENYAL